MSEDLKMMRSVDKNLVVQKLYANPKIGVFLILIITRSPRIKN